MIRQGDVLLIPVPKPPRNPVRVLDESGNPPVGVRIAGERTGHAHELRCRVYGAGARTLIFLERPTPLTHEEHAAVTVPAGWHEVRTQREYVPAERPRRRYD